MLTTLLTCGVQVSVYSTLPETKSVSLERMYKVFSEVDAVEAGEQERGLHKAEAMELSTAEHRELTGEKSTTRRNKSPDRAVE